STVNQRQTVANSNDTAPRPFPDQLAKAHRLKSKGKNVAIGRREIVDKRYHWSREPIRRIRVRHPIACYPDHHQRATQPFDHERRNKSTAVATNIDNQRVFADLREVQL